MPECIASHPFTTKTQPNPSQHVSGNGAVIDSERAEWQGYCPQVYAKGPRPAATAAKQQQRESTIFDNSITKASRRRRRRR